MPAELLVGLPAAPGVGVAAVRRLAPALTSLPELPAAEDPERESEAARAALAEVAADLRERGARSTAVAGEVLDALAQLVEDPALDAEVQRRTDAGEPAAAAVWAAFEAFADQLTQLGGAFAERAADLIDLRSRVAARLLGLDGGPASPSESGEPVVLTGDDLSPADAATLEVDSTAAIVTRRGGPTSHTAIVARSLGIPAVVGCAGALEIDEGVRVLVDGDQGQILVSPSEEQVQAALERVRDRATRAAEASGPGRTADGHPVALMVNAGGPADVAELDAGCAGVGLLRTELLFLNRSSAPDVEEQRALYRAVLERLEGRTAVVRTLDAGADKPLPFATEDDEPNPALGVRGFRLDRVQPQLLDDQLEAISLAADGLDVELRVMAPMVATLAEAAAFVERARAHGIGRAGVMVEVPALALLADDLVEIVDFVCLGTNDLSQYSLAADRTLGSLGDLLDPWQPGLLRLAAPILAAARRRDIPGSVCGEAASNEQLACVLVGLGATSLSTSPAALPAVRAALGEHPLAACEAAARAALAATSAEEARVSSAQALAGHADTLAVR